MGESLLAAFHVLVMLFQIIREDPRIGIALAVLLIGGIAAAILIRRRVAADFPTIK